MFKKMLCAIGIFVVAGAASADTEWHFGYTGFENAATHEFEPIQFFGSFRGEDVDADGILQRSELTAFTMRNTFNLSNPNDCAPMDVCELREFSYDLHTGQLDFNAYAEHRAEMSGSSWEYVTGDHITIMGWSPWAGTVDTWLWTDQTRFDITPAPVPEPAMAWLLGAGLMGMGVAARRRR